ncbi:hypothetical protein T492DRAFT_1096218 [Pavlovales sp. CCMP2436]|nr:hypothetical protein T492DRAFT_1096218 [Pavlovales sp. CCMP2436]
MFSRQKKHLGRDCIWLLPPSPPWAGFFTAIMRSILLSPPTSLLLSRSLSLSLSLFYLQSIVHYMSLNYIRRYISQATYIYVLQFS